MDYMSTLPLVNIIGFTLLFILIDKYRYDNKAGESTQLTPRYELGQCIVFEHDKKKKSGVILCSEIVEAYSPDFRGVDRNNNTVIIPRVTRKIRYVVDTMHMKYDNDIHKDVDIVMPTPDERKIDGKVNIVWVYEDNVNCVDCSNVG